MIYKPYFITEEEERKISLEEKTQYIKDNLGMTESPIGGNYTPEQIDNMLYLIENDWKESGGHWYEWIQTVYYDMQKINNKK